MLRGKSQLCISFKSKLEGRESGQSPPETENCEKANRKLGFRCSEGIPGDPGSGAQKSWMGMNKRKEVKVPPIKVKVRAGSL